MSTRFNQVVIQIEVPTGREKVRGSSGWVPREFWYAPGAFGQLFSGQGPVVSRSLIG